MTLSQSLAEILRDIWEAPQTVSSNFAREFAAEVAFLASLGYISTIHPSIALADAAPSRCWRITASGLHSLRETPL